MSEVDDFLNLSNKGWKTTTNVDIALNEIFNQHKANISMLWLNRNQLEVIPQAILLLTNLEILSLQENSIEYLPDWIVKMTSLTSLNLTGNKIQTLPRIIGNMTNLKHLWLSRNCLVSLPSSMIKLTELESLTLAYNSQFPRYRDVYYIQSFGDTQYILSQLAFDEWRPRARAAVVRWILCAAYAGLCNKDVAKLIGKIIYDTRNSDVWDWGE